MGHAGVGFLSCLICCLILHFSENTVVIQTNVGIRHVGKEEPKRLLVCLDRLLLSTSLGSISLMIYRIILIRD